MRKKKFFSTDKVTGGLGEVITGKVPGRQSDDEITFLKQQAVQLWILLQLSVSMSVLFLKELAA